MNDNNFIVSFNVENGGFLQSSRQISKPQRKVKDLVIETREL